MKELMFSLAVSAGVGIAAVVIINDVRRDLETEMAAFRRDTEVAVCRLVDARKRDMEAARAANDRLWLAVINGSPRGTTKNLSQAEADRFDRCEDKTNEALDHGVRNMEEQHGRRAR